MRPFTRPVIALGHFFIGDSAASRAAALYSAVTAGARELCCRMGMSSDFRTAAADLRRVGGLGACPERLTSASSVERAVFWAFPGPGCRLIRVFVLGRTE